MRRPEIRLHSLDLQKLVDEFTLGKRPWMGFPIDKVEYMMKFYHVLPAGFYYARFDEDSNEAVFQGSPFPDVPYTVIGIRQACPALPASAKLLLPG